ncbi:MAG: hypothetical protein ABIJ16_07330 [Bacteroidota bacterium]
MRKINLKDYTVEVRMQQGVEQVNYEVKTSIVNLLFHPDLKLNAVALLEQNKLAEKILATEQEILLEEAEYGKVKQAVGVVTGLGKNDVELVKRVLEAEEISVVEK